MIEVVAAILQNEQGEILICQRPQGKNCALLWEFPGGKIEQGEAPKTALLRECKEELSVDIAVECFFDESTYHYPEIDVHITFWLGKIVNGVVKTTEHVDTCWTSPKSTEKFSFCPADENVLEKLRNSF